MLKRSKLSTREELDAKLQTFGTSMDHQKRAFIEQALTKQWLREQTRIEEPRRDELLRDHIHGAESELRQKIKDDRRRKELEEYLARLRQDIPVYTVFDDDSSKSPANH